MCVYKSWSIMSASPLDKTKSLEKLTLRAVNGSVIHTYGHKGMFLHFGLRRDFLWTFTIAEITTPILGADFLHHYSLLIDLK